MVKKKKVAKKKALVKVAEATTCCTSDNSCFKTGKDWFLAVVSEVALYFFFWYGLYVLGASVNLWLASLILLVLINVSWFTCPCTRKLCKC